MTDLTDLNLNWLNNGNNKYTKNIYEISVYKYLQNEEMKKISTTIIIITATIITATNHCIVTLIKGMISRVITKYEL